MNSENNLKKALIDLRIKSGDIIKVRKKDDLLYSPGGGETVSIRFSLYDMNEKVISFPASTLIRDALIEYLKETNSRIDISPEKIFFLFNAKVLNSEQYLNKTLEEVKIKNNSKINVRNNVIIS